MVKVTLNLDDFKALASDTRLEILKALDKKKMSLQEISTTTKLHEVTIHEHLAKLVSAGFVKKIEREGHKFVFYHLSWKGSTLLHPENTRVVILFSSMLFCFGASVISVLSFFNKISFVASNEISKGPQDILSYSYNSGPSFLGTFTICCVIVFCVLLVVSLWRYKKNKVVKL